MWMDLVENNYKWSTFYANAAWAFLIISFGSAVPGGGRLAALFAVGVLLRASYVQWTYFVGYVEAMFTDNAES